jgi:hypothetical protein
MTSGAVENYEVIETIGKGTFGTVSKIKRKADGRVTVLKNSIFMIEDSSMEGNELREDGREREATISARSKPIAEASSSSHCPLLRSNY